MKIMLCGASDTQEIAQAFKNVVSDFGATTMYYVDATTRYENSSDSDWIRNSRDSVTGADICVFVLMEKIGDITWFDELDEALDSGKLFLVFCKAATLDKYYYLRREGYKKNKKDNERLVNLLDDLHARNLTIVRFVTTEFEAILREQVANKFTEILSSHERYMKRQALVAKLTAGNPLSDYEKKKVLQIALDEFEEKSIRKMALMRLIEYGVGEKDCLQLIASNEQGVSRLAIENLDRLCSNVQVSAEFISHCVSICNTSDDVGLARRFVKVILDVNFSEGLVALRELELREVGIKRRIVVELINHKKKFKNSTEVECALKLLRSCLAKTEDLGWKHDGAVLVEHLENMKTTM